jgi:hypothetical protein
MCVCVVPECECLCVCVAHVCVCVWHMCVCVVMRHLCGCMCGVGMHIYIRVYEQAAALESIREWIETHESDPQTGLTQVREDECV